MRRSITKKLLVSTLAASVFVTLAGISTFASAATTLFGFLALTFMNFQIECI